MVMQGIWPEYQNDMRDYVGYEVSSTVLVILTTFQIFADRSNFRGIIKKKAAEVVCLFYDFYPTESFNNQEEQAEYIKSTIERIIYRGRFLRGGLDDKVSFDDLRWNDSDESSYRDVPAT